VKPSEGKRIKKPRTLAQGLFQNGKFLGYYDLTLTATRTWNDNGHFEFHCKINAKKGKLLAYLPNFINRMMLTNSYLYFYQAFLNNSVMTNLQKTFLFIFIFFQSYPLFSQISFQRIEPPSWWAGMEDSSLQLLVYGKDLAETDVIVHYPGIILRKTIKLENPDYLVLNLEIAKDARPGMIPLVFEYQREIVFSVDYELKSRDKGSRERKGFGKDDVIYLLMPDRFSNGDRRNDTVESMLEVANPADLNGRHGGDIKGISDKLDYIAGLGVTALWLNPLLENNMPAYSYHGYAITDFYRVDPRFGDNVQYKSLVEECHRKGLKVIIDMVFNHCGSNHWWMKDLPMDSWIHQFPEFTRSNFRAEAVMDPYASDFDRQKMLTGWFDKNMPDLNQHNEFLASYLIQNSIWWVEFAGLDGIRMDTYPYSYKDFMAKWMQRLLKEYPNFRVVGETWQQKETNTAYWETGSPVSGKYDSYLPSVTDFPMQYALKDAFMEKEGWTTGLAKLYYVLAQDFIYPDPFSNVIFADNHDLTRFYTDIGEDLNKFKMAMAFLLTTRGIPVIYYGTELLMTGEEPKGHGFIRQDFPLGEWRSAVGGQQSAVGGQQLEASQYIQTLLNWRKGSKVIHHGKLKQFIPQDGIYVYFRYNEKDAVMVVINKNKESRKPDLERFKEMLKDYRAAKDVLSGRGIILADGLEIAGETAMVLDLD
jgi:neopullulanase